MFFWYLWVLVGLPTGPTNEDVFRRWVAIALIHNPRIQAEEQRRAAQKEIVRLAGAWEDPRLKWTYMLESVETRVGPQEQRLGVEQKWVLPRKRSSERAESRAWSQAANHAYDGVRAEVTAQVRRVYARAFYLGQAIRLTQDHLQLLRDLERVIQQRYSVSKARYQDLIQIQIELNTLENRLADLRAQKPSLDADIEAALGQTQVWEFPSFLSIPLQEDIHILLDDQQAQLTQSPTRLEAATSLQAAQYRQEVAKNASLPDFMFGLEYVATGEAANPTTPGSGKDPIMFMVGFNLPVWRGQNQAKRALAAAQATMMEQQLRSLDLDQKRQFQKIAFQLGEAYRKRDLFDKRIIPQAQEALAVSLSAYQSESASYLELMDNERNLLTFLLTRSEAERDIWLALADLESVLGSEALSEVNHETP